MKIKKNRQLQAGYALLPGSDRADYEYDVLRNGKGLRYESAQCHLHAGNDSSPQGRCGNVGACASIPHLSGACTDSECYHPLSKAGNPADAAASKMHGMLS